MCFGICVGGSHAVDGAFEAAEGEDAVCAGDVAGYHLLVEGGCVGLMMGFWGGGDDDEFGVSGDGDQDGGVCSWLLVVVDQV